MTATPPGDRHLTWHPGHLTREERWTALGPGVAGATVWLTGLSGSGKSTIAALVEARLLAAGRPAYLLDGDNLRHGLTADLGFTDADRAANVARVAEVARLLADAGMVALVSLISPFRAGGTTPDNSMLTPGSPFFEVWVNAPLEVCEERDPKGLYSRARAGKVRGFTGIDSPYEEPLGPDLVLATDVLGVDAAAAAVLALLVSDGA